jgi:phosphate/sulfate permease
VIAWILTLPAAMVFAYAVAMVLSAAGVPLTP